MGKIGSFGASLSLHAGALALFLIGPLQETPQASVAPTTPSPLTVSFRAAAPPSFDRELPAEVAPRNSESDSPPGLEAPAPEVEAEESPVEIQNPPPAYPTSA